MDPLFHTTPFPIQWRLCGNTCVCVCERASSLPDVCCAAAFPVYWFTNPGRLTTGNFPLHVQLGFTLTGQGRFFSVTLPFFPFLLLGQASIIPYEWDVQRTVSLRQCLWTHFHTHSFILGVVGWKMSTNSASPLQPPFYLDFSPTYMKLNKWYPG